MSVSKIEWHWFYGTGNGAHTVDVNIPPAWVGAQVALHGHSGGGLAYTGIRHYRKRLSSGRDEEHDFGDWTNWPPVIFDFISSVTFALGLGEDQDGWLVARMDYWS